MNVKSRRLNLCLDRQKVVFCHISLSKLMMMNKTTLGQPLVNPWSTLGQPFVKYGPILGSGQAGSPHQSHINTNRYQVIDHLSDVSG